MRNCQGSTPVLALETDTQAELKLARPWIVSVVGNHTERGRAVDIHGRIRRLEVVQDVGELEHQRYSYLFSDLDLLRKAHLEVPGRETANDAGAAQRFSINPRQTTAYVTKFKDTQKRNDLSISFIASFPPDGDVCTYLTLRCGPGRKRSEFPSPAM